MFGVCLVDGWVTLISLKSMELESSSPVWWLDGSMETDESGDDQEMKKRVTEEKPMFFICKDEGG